MSVKYFTKFEDSMPQKEYSWSFQKIVYFPSQKHFFWQKENKAFLENCNKFLQIA